MIYVHVHLGIMFLGTLRITHLLVSKYVINFKLAVGLVLKQGEAFFKF